MNFLIALQKVTNLACYMYDTPKDPRRDFEDHLQSCDDDGFCNSCGEQE